MPATEETAAVLSLVRRGDRRWHHYADLIEMRGSAIAVLNGDYEDPGEAEALTLFEEKPQTSATEPDLGGIIEEIQTWESEGLHLYTVLDSEYPANLRSIHNRPPFVFVRGELRPTDEDAIAVVGTRKPTARADRAAREMAGGIADAGYTVASGLAEGIDRAAHEGALVRGGRTVAVIGTGLRTSYPRANAQLQERLGRESAVLSQFWPDAPPTRHSFLMRNVVMSGFALATVVIAAAEKSGAKSQARHALEHGRPVFLFESLLENEWARKYAELPGTHVVATANEVLAMIERLLSVETLSA